MSTVDFAYGAADQDIYTGVWVNWSRGRIFGATITLTSRDGTLVVAFLALFVSVGGTSFWRIVCFGLHHLYSTEAPRNALHHQRQTILRNSTNATYGLSTMIQTLWAWRRNNKIRRLYRRILPLSAITMLIIVIFATASTFSSKIASAMGCEVLVSSKNCGTLYPGDSDSEELTKSFYPNAATEIVAAANYAQQCYSAKTTSETCRQYIKLRLPTVVVRHATCPFRSDMCKLENENIVFDTGYLDSHSDLGINAPLQDRVTFRRVTSCAPLVTEGFTESIRGIDWESNYTRYLYGPQDISSNITNEVTWVYPEFSEKEFFATNTATTNKGVFTLG